MDHAGGIRNRHRKRELQLEPRLFAKLYTNKAGRKRNDRKLPTKNAETYDT